jgi:hypothetical protein
MKIVLGGKFESAFVRMSDEVSDPRRNTTPHRYYVDLNRNTEKAFRDGAATFVALARATNIPSELDWGESEIAARCGTTRNSNERTDLQREKRNDEIDKLLRIALTPDVLTPLSRHYVTTLDPKGYNSQDAAGLIQMDEQGKSDLLRAYIRRFLHQIFAARDAEAFLIVAEEDLRIIQEIGTFLKAQDAQQIDFPDLTNRVIDPDCFLDGILNFSPPDIEALEAVKKDKEIARYAERVAKALQTEDQAALNQAAIEAYVKTKTTQRVDTAFEVAKWAVKPLRYIPVASQAIALAEDISDAVDGIEKIYKPRTDWHLIGVKMQTIAIEDFLRRKANQ